MPYKTEGSIVYHKKGGKWKIKQIASTPEKAKSTMRLLYGIEQGWKPTGKGLAVASKETRRRVARLGGKARRR